MLGSNDARIDTGRQAGALADAPAPRLDPNPITLLDAVSRRGLGVNFGRRLAIGLAQVFNLPVLGIEKIGN